MSTTYDIGYYLGTKLKHLSDLLDGLEARATELEAASPADPIDAIISSITVDTTNEQYVVWNYMNNASWGGSAPCPWDFFDESNPLTWLGVYSSEDADFYNLTEITRVPNASWYAYFKTKSIAPSEIQSIMGSDGAETYPTWEGTCVLRRTDSNGNRFYFFTPSE